MTRNITLSLDKAKEWYKQGGELKEVALQAYTKEELEAKQPPRTWNEFCTSYSIGHEECYIGLDSKIHSIKAEYDTEFDLARFSTSDRNFISSYEEAEAFLALMQLRQLRKVWVGDWKPDWTSVTNSKWCISLFDTNFLIEEYHNYEELMSFPTREMAQDFYKCFKGLIEKTKPLYQ